MRRSFFAFAPLLALAATLLAQDPPATPALEESRPAAPAALKAQVRDSFLVKDLPAGTKKVRAWFELPQEEPLQNITDLKITAPEGYKITTEPVDANRFLYVEIADPKAATFEVTVTFTIERWESAPSATKAGVPGAEEKKALAAKLADFPNGETTDKIREKAGELSKGVADPVAQARKFYDFIIDNAEYWKKDPDHLKPSGKGSATYCMDSKTGNCTDFHALFQAMARTVDLPTQFVMGTALKKELDGVEKFDDPKKEPSYHCWIRTYYAGRGWVYSDISYADMNDAKRDYYFDHIDASRVAFSHGRNIDLAPKQEGAKLNWFVKCFVEADGKEHAGWTRELTWKSVK
ncbi:MAG: transglutaminase-like domain-containing protein [Planctomycetes bacterium]|nr:transglutaminase-like domain-containing protein [Planctomycetota bacterium]